MGTVTASEASAIQKRVLSICQSRFAMGNETILICEDEQAIREIMGQFLCNLGYTILDESSGENACSMLGEQQIKPDLLLTDLSLPGISGIDLANKLRDRWSDLKVLLMSGSPIEDCREAPSKSRDYAFIAKPFKIKELAVKIREVLDN